MKRLNPTNIGYQPAKPLTRTHSKIQQIVRSKDEKIEKLRKEMQLSKQVLNENKHSQFQTTINENNKNEINSSKNIRMASAPRG